MEFISIIEQVSEELINSFNQRDFDKLATFLAVNFYIESENITKIYPNHKTNIIKGVPNAIEYWKELVKVIPEFRFKPTDHRLENQGKNILYSGRLFNGKPYNARFIMNEYAKFECLVLMYPESI